MNQNQKKPQKELDQDALVDLAWERLLENKSDEIEGTFCYELFEGQYFNEKLFLSMCEDMRLVIKTKSTKLDDYQLLIWIISCTFRSVFSHFDKNDRYKIKNFNEEIASKWGGEYFEEFRSFLDEIFLCIIDGKKQ